MRNRTRKILIGLLTATIIAGGTGLPAYCGPSGPLQGKAELLKFRNATASQVLSAEGEPIGRFFIENRTNISYGQIPQYMINALVATEDARFFEHAGVDYRSLFRVLFKTILSNNRRSGGGSTITQQLAKNMYGRRHYAIFSVFRNKMKEIFLASRLEKVFTKEEIITLYLNTVSFGENVFGIEAASQLYFNRNTENLKIEEAAVLTGMLKATTYYNPHLNPENASSRRNVVLRQMEKYKYLTVAKADSLCQLPMVQHYSRLAAGGPADYFLVQVKAEAQSILKEIYADTKKKWNIEEDGLVLTTTLSLPLQKCANEAFARHLPVMQAKLNKQYSSASAKKSLGEISDSLREALTTLQAGLLAVDPRSGAVRAWVGGIDFRTQPYDQVSARRQLGSVFKPVLYAAALEEGMEPCQYLDNDSVTLSGFKDWSPENYDHSYGGKYSLAGALVKSMNIPTFSLFLNVGFEKVDMLWRQMGFSFPLDNTPSLALGTAEASIREVAVAYSSFANGGYKITPQCIASIKTSDGQVIWQNEFPESSERVITERSSLLMNAMLQKAIRNGTGASLYSVYGVSVPLAGKTGTSQNYADAWFAAYNPDMVIVSRVGASSPTIHFNSGSDGSGSALALPLVALTLKKAESYPELKEMLSTDFPALPPELAVMLDCPDFRETNFFDRLIDLFQKDEITYDPENRKAVHKVKSILEKIFRK
ncbi:MAG TPA: transglycosylase domain-containing protein [Bacteroidales bacterium]|nr:transglycosylase domain-containing protein [Bacteroidales bacterium]